MKGLKSFFSRLGPGVITGAADDDPSGIATYSQAGAQFGFGQLWTALFMLPFITAVQEACARIGAVTGRGLASVVKLHYPRHILYLVVSLVVIANITTIGADIGAMAAAAQLLIPLPFIVLTLIFTTTILLLEIFTTYRVYSRILKWFTLSLLTYLASVFIIKIPWGEATKLTFVPHIEISFPFLFIITGVFGTTITPFMFFWQASEEVEEEKIRHVYHHGHPQITTSYMRHLRLDNFIGMLYSELITWAIILCAGATLHFHGITNINSASDAALALEPLVQSFPYSGTIAKVLFAVGIFGIGMTAVPVLAGSTAYAIGEVFGWPTGLNLKFHRAKGFYGVILIATFLGLLINYLGIDPIKNLIFASVLNGLSAVPLIYFITRISSNETIMGNYVSGRVSKTFLWGTFVFMSVAGIGMFLVR